jgi:hypothetical protein
MKGSSQQWQLPGLGPLYAVQVGLRPGLMKAKSPWGEGSFFYHPNRVCPALAWSPHFGVDSRFERGQPEST